MELENTDREMKSYEIVAYNRKSRLTMGCKQNCKLSRSLMSLLNVNIGSYISIDLHTFKLLGCVKFCQDQESLMLEVDETVKYDLRNEYLSQFPDVVSLNLDAFKKLKVMTAKRISITAVFKNSQTLSLYNKIDQMKDLLKGIMNGFGVVSGSVIDLSHSKRVQLYGMEFVVVTHCSTDHDVVGIISSKTVITVEESLTKSRYTAMHHSDLQSKCKLGGLERQKQLLEKFIKFPIRNKTNDDKESKIKCTIVIGPCGSGKTSLVRSVVKHCKASLVEFVGCSINRSVSGETFSILKKYFQEAMHLSEEGLCVLFIDELDSLFPSKTMAGFSKTLVSQLKDLLDKTHRYPNLSIIGATNKPELLNNNITKGLQGRFRNEIYIGIPAQGERKDIIHKLLAKNCCSLGNVDVETLAKMTHGFVGSDLERLCNHTLIEKPKEDDLKLVLNKEDFEKSLRNIQPSVRRSTFAAIDFKPTTWDEIGGLHETKKLLRECVEWPSTKISNFKALGLSCPNGVLLYGPPGCCKTTLVRAVATACNATFFSASAAQIYSPYVGDSEKAIADLFHQARINSPAIIFLDEIDSIVGNRGGDPSEGIHKKVLATLLNEMDGIGVKASSIYNNNESLGDRDIMVIAATNRPELLDAAVRRPGRLDRMIYVPAPDAEEREQILKVLTAKMPIENFDAKRIAEKTEYFTGADMQQLCREAVFHAARTEGFDIKSIANHHIEHVLKTMRPSLTEEVVQSYNLLYTKLETSPFINEDNIIC